MRRKTNDGWTKRTVEWSTRGRKRSLGRPPKPWEGVFVADVSHLYLQLAMSLELESVSREQGKPGKPGLYEQDGVSEPGAVGAPGNRGQSGRPGKKGVPGEPGEDAV
ncbi:hypothetical protein KIN20_027144 [Parelaphostrongylus tenuis]|uniref:Uncharacterized protein n=1 Tax=Parelaphostrongylus tenuis TaxID=148309 RepID=A0AAD5WDH4_PARTN|nr:hypothetical protein KIN20_027144 [Parelaphostrongylus tenuis]